MAIHKSDKDSPQMRSLDESIDRSARDRLDVCPECGTNLAARRHMYSHFLLISSAKPLVLRGVHITLHDAVPMTKDEIIARREEAIEMRWSMIIIDEAAEVTPEMWNRLPFGLGPEYFEDRN